MLIQKSWIPKKFLQICCQNRGFFLQICCQIRGGLEWWQLVFYVTVQINEWPTKFENSIILITFLKPISKYLSCAKLQDFMTCKIKGSHQKKKNGKSWCFGPTRGGGSDRIPTFCQIFPKPNLPWNCP